MAIRRALVLCTKVKSESVFLLFFKGWFFANFVNFVQVREIRRMWGWVKSAVLMRNYLSTLTAA